MFHQGGKEIANFSALYKFLSFNIFFDNWLKSKKERITCIPQYSLTLFVNLCYLRPLKTDTSHQPFLTEKEGIDI